MTVQPVPEVEPSPYYFNARELARLAIYRAAVVARFYNDQCESPSLRTSAAATRLLKSACMEQAA
jgi:hypothetical protein